MSQDLTVTDLFCGAGGASIGMVAAGATITEAANHWARAVETYSTNHQDTRVRCADISQTHPSRFEKTDVLWASPECTTFSQAGPKRRKADLFDQSNDAYVERSRVTMWDVVQFAEWHRYRAIIVENVVDIGRWELLQPWFSAMLALGYTWRVVSLNSMVAHPTPQSRDRWYVVFWQGIPAPDLEIRPACWCASCDTTVEGRQMWKRPDARWGKYRQQYTYGCPTCHKQALPWVWPAASAIDWSLPCERIGDRSKPLAPATRRRIEVGLERYGPAIVQGAGNTYERPGYYRTWPAWQPLRSLTSTNQFGLALPGFVLDAANTGSAARYAGTRVRDPREPLFTETASNRNALVVPVHHGETGPGAHPPAEPLGTQSGRQETALVVPMRSNGRALPAESAPLPTATTADGGGSHLVSLPFITELRGGNSDASAVTDPLATFAAGGNHHGLTVPPGMLVRMNGGMADAGCMATAADGPMGTLTGKAHQGVVPFLTPYYGNSTPSPVDAPTPTVTSVDRCALVEPASVEVDDCGFRMLEPPEAGLGMGFPSTYVVGGSKRDQVRQYGQAVTPPASAVLLGRIFEAMS